MSSSCVFDFFKKSVLKLSDRTVHVKPSQIKEGAFHTCAASEGTFLLNSHLTKKLIVRATSTNLETIEHQMKLEDFYNW